LKTHIELTSKYGGRVLFPAHEIMVDEDTKDKTVLIYLHGGGVEIKESYDEVKKLIEDSSK